MTRKVRIDVDPADLAVFNRLRKLADAAADGDSNDKEIDLLKDTVEQAVAILGLR